MKKRLKDRVNKQILLLIASALATSLIVLYETVHSPHLSSTSPLKVRLDRFSQVNTTLPTRQPPQSDLLSAINPNDADWVDPFYNIPSDGTNLWDDEDSRLPAWMKAYFNWHKYKRQQPQDNRNWTQESWLVMQCLASQDPWRCGGTADRLKPLPLLLRLAYENHRILVIHWTRPAPLETFLVPPHGGLDWRAPYDLAEALEDESNGMKFASGKDVRQYATQSNLTLLRTRLQTDKAGQADYDSMIRHTDELKFDHVFAPLWRIFFRPSKAIEAKIEDFLEANQLTPGQYVASHLRALYGIESRSDSILLRLTVQAVNCSSQLRPDDPIYFASDSSKAAQLAQRYASEMGGRVVVHSPDPDPPLHFDLDPNWKRRKPTDYFDTFIDLYLIALAGCVAFSQGGFGHWGLLIGGNVTCQINSKTRRSGRFINECQWKGGTRQPSQTGTLGEQQHRPPLFPEPMV